MKTLMSLTLSIFVAWPSLGLSKQILECMQPVNLNDPNFVQGSELFFDIFLSEEGLVEIRLTKGNLESEIFLSQGAERSSQLSEEDGLFFVEWEKPSKISLVIRDFGDRWRGEFWFSEGYKTSLVEILPGRDLDLSCLPKGRLKF